MLRQEIVVCQKCGAVKELADDCEWSDEKDKSFRVQNPNLDS